MSLLSLITGSKGLDDIDLSQYSVSELVTGRYPSFIGTSCVVMIVIGIIYLVVKKGVRFYLYEDGFMHSKTVVVDGKKSSIGSANFDDRSAYYNFDANALFQSESISAELKGIFEKDLDHCREFDPSDYPSFISWIKILICGIVRPLA